MGGSKYARYLCVCDILKCGKKKLFKFSWEVESMRDIYVCVIFLRVSHFFDVHFSYCEAFMCQVLGGLKTYSHNPARNLTTAFIHSTVTMIIPMYIFHNFVILY